MYKVKGGEAFHLIALQTPVCGIVNLFEISLVSERRILGKLRYGSLDTVIPFACKEHGKECVRIMDCGVVLARKPPPWHVISCGPSNPVIWCSGPVVPLRELSYCLFPYF